MEERILYQEILFVDGQITRFQIQQAIEDCRKPRQRLPLIGEEEEGKYTIIDTWPADGNVHVDIKAPQNEARPVTITALRIPRTRTNRPYAPDAVSHAQGLATAIRTVEVGRKRAGRPQDGATVWLEHMLVVKGKPPGSKPEGNPVFDLWRRLNDFDANREKDDAEEAWERYVKAVRRIGRKNT